MTIIPWAKPEPALERYHAHLAEMRQEVKGTLPAGEKPLSRRSKIEELSTRLIRLPCRPGCWRRRDYLSVRLTRRGTIAQIIYFQYAGNASWEVIAFSEAEADLAHVWVTHVLARRTVLDRLIAERKAAKGN